MTDDIAQLKFLASKLADHSASRWSHVQAVAKRASAVSRHLESGDAARLVGAAWAHDVGYLPELVDTGFHPLDGARHLLDAGFDRRLCALVAHHSSALAEAGKLGLDKALSEFQDEHGVVRDLLWYLDMTTGPQGQLMTFYDRMADVRARYEPENYVMRALNLGMPEREAAVRRAEEWVESVGLTGQV